MVCCSLSQGWSGMSEPEMELCGWWRVATALDDPKQLLKGTGDRIRHVKVTAFAEFDKNYLKQLLKQAHQLTLNTLDKKTQPIVGQSIVKSISPNKKRPN
jgi:hypothetical protein